MALEKAMVRRLMIVLAVLVTANLWAGDPWKGKSYKDWNENDVRKILNESPWAKRIELQGIVTKHPSLEGSEDSSTTGEAGGEGGEEEAGRGGDLENERRKRQLILVIRWTSSRTMREAWARGQVLQKRILEADTDRFLPSTPDDYELLLVGSDMTLFERAIEATLKENSYLLPKKSQQRINPNHVELVRTPNGKRIKGVIFHFPKKTPTSQPIFSADEKELRFVSRGGTTEIKASFDLREMVDKEGLDL
jgi:hypothetical protein